MWSKWFGKAGSFRQNALIMSSGAAINVILSLALTPVVTRLYDKAEFGVLYLFVSIITIAAMVITGMYHNAFVVPKLRIDFLALLRFTLTMVLLGLVAMGILLVAIGAPLLEALGAPELIPYRGLIFVGLMLTCLNFICLQWNVRCKEFKKNATASIIGGAGIKGAQIGLAGMAAPTFPNLMWAKILADTLRLGVLTSRKMYRDAQLLLRISWQQAVQQGTNFVKYPKYVLSGNFVNRFTGDLPLYALTSYYGMSEVGAFGFAVNMLNIPYNVLGNSIAPVYFQRANELYHVSIEKLQEFTEKSYQRLLILGGLAFGFVFGFGDIAFGLIFSESWRLAGEFARILSIYFVFRIISSPFSTVFRVVRQEQYGLYINIIIASCRMLGLFVGLYLGDLFSAVIGYSIGNIFGYGATNLMVFKAVQLPILKHLFRTSTIIVILFGGFYLLRMIFDQFIPTG